MSLNINADKERISSITPSIIGSSHFRVRAGSGTDEKDVLKATIDPVSKLPRLGINRSGDAIDTVTMLTVGANYSEANTIVVFDPPPAGGVQATGDANITNGQVLSITVTNRGSGYATPPDISIVDTSGGPGSGTGATAECSLNIIEFELDISGAIRTSTSIISDTARILNLDIDNFVSPQISFRAPSFKIFANATLTQWTAGESLDVDDLRFIGDNVYVCVQGGFTGGNPPTHLNGQVANGSTILRHAGVRVNDINQEFYGQTIWPETVTPPFGDQTAKVATTEFVYRLATNDVGGRVYVSQQIGDDSNDGRSAAKPVRTIKRAAQIAAGTPDKESLIIAGGDYSEDNPISIPPDCSVVGDNLRLVLVRPNNPGKHMFKLSDKNYIIGLTFKDKLDGQGQPESTWNFAVVFDDKQRLYYDRRTGGNQFLRDLPIGHQIFGPNRQRLKFDAHTGSASTLIDGVTVTGPTGNGTVIDVVFSPGGQTQEGHIDINVGTGSILSNDTITYVSGGSTYSLAVRNVTSIRAEGEIVKHVADTDLEIFTISKVDGSQQSSFDGGVVFTCTVEPSSHEFKPGQKVRLSGLPTSSPNLSVFNGLHDVYDIIEDADGRSRRFVIRCGKSHPFTSSSYSPVGAQVRGDSPYILATLLNSPNKISPAPLAFDQVSYDTETLILNNRELIADEAVERTLATFTELEIPNTTITGILENTSDVISGISDTSALVVGQVVTSTSPGFPTGTITITDVTADSITISANATQDSAFTGTVEGNTKCKRDTRFMLEAIARDLRSGGTYHTIEAANLYKNGNVTQHIGSEISESIYTFEQAKELTVRAIRNRLTYFTGASWTTQVTTGISGIQEIAYNGTTFVAVGDGGEIATSSDAITWTRRNTDQTVTANNLEDVVWTGTKFLAVGFNGTIITSTDGVSWFSATSGTSQSLRAVTWDGDKAIIVGANGVVLKSEDLTTWSSASSVPSSIQMNDVVYRETGAGTGYYIACGQLGSIWTSTDGDTWTSRTSGSSENLEGVSFDEDKIVVVGINGEIVNSEDGVTWKPATLVPNSLNLNEVHHDGNRFWAAGVTGNLLYSEDGAVWIGVNSGTSETLSAVVSGYNILVIAGSNGIVRTSTQKDSVIQYSNLGIYENQNLTAYQGSPAIGSNVDFSCSGVVAAFDTLFNLFIDILTNNANNRFIDAASLIGKNQTFIEEEALEYAKVTTGLILSSADDTKCKRDIGYILSALRRDLVLGGNAGIVTAGEAYFTAGVLTGIPSSELAGTRAAFGKAMDLAVLAMRNWRTANGTPSDPTYTPVYSSTPLVFDYGVTVDTSSPVCANVASAINTSKTILDNILTQTQGYTKTYGTAYTATPVYPEGSFTDANGIRFTVTAAADDLPTIEASPYIQNASIISKLGGGGCEIDGDKIKQPNCPFPGLEPNGQATFPNQGKSMVANAFTIVSEGGTGYLVKNDGYTQLVSVFCIFTQDGVLCDSGGYASITNSASNFGTYALRAVGYRKDPYSFDIGSISSVNQTATGRTILTIDGLGREPLEHFIVKIRQGGIDYVNVQPVEYTIENVTPLTTVAPFRAECELSGAMLIKNPNTNSIVPVGANLQGAQARLHRPSICNSSSHTWEFVGAGNTYRALPENGGVKITANEQVSQAYGRVYTSGTDELGDFKVGYFASIENRTGNITFAGSVTISEVEFLKLKGGSVVVTGFSADNTLGGNFSSDSLIPTQKAVKDYIGNNLGQFLGKQYSTNAIPRRLVELTDSGKINIDQIPALRPFNVFSVKNASGRLAIEGALAGDIAVQENTEIVNIDPTDIDLNTDYINIPGHGFSTGFKVVWTQGTTTASPLISGTTYYIINIDTDNIQLATTESDASLGTNIVFSSVGTGTHQLEVTTGSTSFILNNDLSSQYLTFNVGNYSLPTGNIVTADLTTAQGQITDYTQGVVFLIAITEGGNGYTSAPSVSFSGGGSPTIPAEAVSTIAGGKVVTITITNPGEGYSSAPLVILGAPPSGGTQATASASVESRLDVDLVNSIKFLDTDAIEDFDTTAGVIKFITLNAPGSNYATGTYNNVATTTDGSGNGATLQVVVNNSGNVSAIAIQNRGTGYDIGDTLEISNSGALNNNSQTGPLLTVNINNPGTGLVDGTYTGVNLLTIGAGSNCVATVVVAGNAIQTVTITGGGQNYTIGNQLFLPGGQGADANGTQAGVNLSVGSVNVGSGFEVGVTVLRGQLININRVVNTSAGLSSNWVSLSSTTVNAADLSGGPISTSVLANNSAESNSFTFLRGDQAYAPVVQSVKKAEPRFYERTNAAAPHLPIAQDYLTFTETTTIEPGYVVSGTGIVSTVPGQVITVAAAGQADGTPTTGGTNYQAAEYQTSSSSLGTGLTVSVTVSNGAVQTVSPELPGEDYNIGDEIYIDTPNGAWTYNNSYSILNRIFYGNKRYDAYTSGNTYDNTNQTLWTASTAVLANDLLYYAENIYKVVADYTTSLTPPTHSSGTADGLTFVRTRGVAPTHTFGTAVTMRVEADISGNGTYTVGETVSGQTSGITANVLSWDPVKYVLVCNQFEDSSNNPLTGSSAKFQAGEDIIGVAGQWTASSGIQWGAVGFLATILVDNIISGGTTVESLVTANGITTVNLSQPVINPGVDAGQTITFTRPASPITLDSTYSVGNFIDEVIIVNAGSGYTNGTYRDVPLTGGSGTGLRANIAITSGSISSVIVTNGGVGYSSDFTVSSIPVQLGTGNGQIVLEAKIGQEVKNYANVTVDVLRVTDKTLSTDPYGTVGVARFRKSLTGGGVRTGQFVIGDNGSVSIDQGAESGLDSDKLDGKQGSYYIQAGNLVIGYEPGRENEAGFLGGYVPSNLLNGLYTQASIGGSSGSTNRLIIATNNTSGAFSPDATETGISGILLNNGQAQDPLADGGSTHGVLTIRPSGSGTDNSRVHQLGFTDNGNLWYRRNTNMSAWNAWRKVWDSGNDGTGSGLDADRLDSFDSTYFINPLNIVNQKWITGTLVEREFLHDTVLPKFQTAKSFLDSVQVFTAPSANYNVYVRGFDLTAPLYSSTFAVNALVDLLDSGSVSTGEVRVKTVRVETNVNEPNQTYTILGVEITSGGFVNTDFQTGLPNPARRIGTISPAVNVEFQNYTPISTSARKVIGIESQSGEAVLELGRTDNVSNTPKIDFHSSGSSSNYDVRLQSTGGGGGTLWTNGVNYTLGTFVYYGNNLYEVTTSGSSGSAPPTHTAGSQSTAGGTAVYTYSSAVPNAQGVLNILGQQAQVNGNNIWHGGNLSFATGVGSGSPVAYDSQANGKAVTRDSSGNVGFNIIYGSLTGAASLNVLKTGDEMTGQLKINNNNGLGISETNGNGNRFKISTSSFGAVLVQNDNSPVIIQTDSGTERVRFRDNANGGYLDLNGYIIASGNTNLTANSTNTSGAKQGSTSGTLLLAGYYDGTGHLTTFGTKYSSGGPVIGYGAAPKRGADGYVSSTGVALGRSILHMEGDGVFEFFGSSSSTTAIGNDLTVSRRMYLNSTGLAIGTAAPQAPLDITKLTSGSSISAVLARQGEGNGSGTGTGVFVRSFSTQYGQSAYWGKTFELSFDFYGTKNAGMSFYRGGSITGGSLAWSTNNGTERMWLESNGVLVVGNVVSYEASDAARVSYNSSYGFIQVNTSDSSRGLAVNSTASTSQTFALFRDNGGTVCQMEDANGSNTQGGMTMFVYRRDSTAGLRLSSNNVVGGGGSSGGEGTMTFYSNTWSDSNFNVRTNPNTVSHAAFKFFSVRSDSTQTGLTISSYGYIGTKDYTSPNSALSIAGANSSDTGSGRVVHNSEYKLEISGYAGYFGAARTIARFQIGQCNAHCEVEARVAHDGGGMHGGWRRLTFAYNCYTATVTTADDNVNWGGGVGWSISRPANGNNGYGDTSTLLDVTWGGATSFNCCGTWYIRVTNHFADPVYLISNYGF